MKILILPSQYITDYKPRNINLFKSYIRNILKKKFSFNEAKSHFYLNEHYHYSHIPLANSSGETFIVGNYYYDYNYNGNNKNGIKIKYMFQKIHHHIHKLWIDSFRMMQ